MRLRRLQRNPIITAADTGRHLSITNDKRFPAVERQSESNKRLLPLAEGKATRSAIRSTGGDEVKGGGRPLQFSLNVPTALDEESSGIDWMWNATSNVERESGKGLPGIPGKTGRISRSIETEVRPLGGLQEGQTGIEEQASGACRNVCTTGFRLRLPHHRPRRGLMVEVWNQVEGDRDLVVPRQNPDLITNFTYLKRWSFIVISVLTTV
ncbi:hypothetical protein BDN72DRAFT_864453 [Pluteus cervinus]|uniref:Uncharacterized protein n=1 Tax=Pluteus cervinus TaxID=181527 RepID=A0ACD3A3M2_9AGAR|nr:hypothetical protein BDN72DRAFT_864453 [Pluteus cervinus]